MENKAKELIIIGGGPGGYIAAEEAARLGANVTIIEDNKLGGTCLHHGCIPTKTLHKNAELIKDLEEIDKFGISIDNYTLDYKNVLNRKNEVINQLESGINKAMQKHKINVLSGKASFVNNHEIQVEKKDGTNEIISADYFIIATGSVPKIPNIPGANTETVLTSKELLDINFIPDKIVVIGGGVVGMEFACIMNQFGSDVTVIEYMKNILPTMDQSLSKRLKSFCKVQGIEIITDAKVTNISKTEALTQVTYSHKKGESTIDCNNVLLSVGRKGNLECLKLEHTDIIHNKSFITVDDNYKTNVDHIYAIGDINGKSMLAHSASYQGVQLMNYLIKSKEMSENIVPACVFTFPEIASVGMTEEEAKEKKLNYKTGKSMFSANGKAVAMGEIDGFIKVIANEDNKIIGVHIIGAHASDIIHEGVLSIDQNISIEKICNAIHAHPTLSETYHEAVRNIL